MAASLPVAIPIFIGQIHLRYDYMKTKKRKKKTNKTHDVLWKHMK